MTIQFKELYLENFKSWKSLHITDFDSKGLCLIYGDNGSGKSSVRQAVEYLLLDKTSDKIAVSDIARDGDKPCKLYCKLVKDDSVIEITKYRNDNEHGNKIFFIIDGDDSRTYTDRRATQREILSVLDINSDYLFASSIFSNNTSSFIELNDNDKKDILYRILSLDKYTTYFEKASNICKKILHDIEKLNLERESLKERIEETDNEINSLEEKSKNFEKEKSISIAELEKEIEDIEYKIKHNKIKHNNLEIECDSIRAEAAVKKLDALNSKQEKLDIQSKIDVLISSISQKKTEKVNLEKNIMNTDCMCPVLDEFCKRLQETSEEIKEKYIPQIDELESKIISYENAKREYQKELIECDEYINEYIKVNKELDNNLYLQREVDSTIENLKTSVSNKKEYLIKQQGLQNNYESYINEKKEKIEDLIKKDDVKKEKIEELTNLYDYYSFWKEGFSKKGIPNLKIESFLSEIEDTVNSNLSLMRDRSYVSISSQKQISSGEYREEINYLINHPEKSITNYNSYSGGERHRLKVADLFAFASLFNKFNFLILDEVLELSLDSLGKEEIVELMKTQSEKYGSVFVISHSSSIQNSFDSVIPIKKTKGVSNVKE